MMKKLALKSVLLVAFAVSPVTAAFAGQSAPEAQTNAYYQIKDVTVTEEIPTAAEIASGYLEPQDRPELHTGVWDDIVNGDWNAIVLVGKQLIEIVKANQAVVNIKSDVVHVVPKGVEDWQALSNWQMPVTKVFTMKVKNGFNMNPVEIRVKVSAMWGGSAGGKGQYLSNVTVVPTSTYTAWGWNLDMWTENGNPVNAGNTDAPVAALGFNIRYKIKTYFNEMNGAQDYYIKGDGTLTQME